MKATFNKQTALALLRSTRLRNPRALSPGKRVCITVPDITPRQRWTIGLAEAFLSDLLTQLETPIQIAVPENMLRPRGKGFEGTIYNAGIPSGAFLEIGQGVTISGPELLFVELAEHMHPVEHLMLGHELCGTFGRDPYDPYNGSAAYGLKPLTSKARIQSFLKTAKSIRGIEAARVSASFLADNAWSPTESLLAAFLRLPIDSLGYDFGELILNPRVEAKHDLPGARSSRVPDIMIAGTSVGINYDGLAHLDLNSIVKAAVTVGNCPGESQSQKELGKAVSSVRAKAIDDIRRNRELAISGLSVFPVMKEDLYDAGGMNKIVAQLVRALEKLEGRDMEYQKRILQNRPLSSARRRMMLSLLPGKHERNVQIGRFIQGHPVVEGQHKVFECWIEL